MKTMIITFSLPVAVLALLLLGCTTTEYTLYLQDVTVKGPITQPPVHVSNNNMERPLRITPHIVFAANSNRTLNGQIEGHSPVDEHGVYRVDTIPDPVTHTVRFVETNGANTRAFDGQNLHWIIPTASFGLDIDYSLSRGVAIVLGATYSVVDGEGLWGYSFGLGFLRETENAAIRFDVGVQWQTLAYDATTVIASKNSSSSIVDVVYFHDKGKDMPLDFYGALTFNTKRDWFTNFFLQVALSKQSLAKFTPTVVAPYSPTFAPATIVNDQRAEFSSTTVIFTPGVYFAFDPTLRLLMGCRINVQTEIKNISPGTTLLPFLQMDWMF